MSKKVTIDIVVDVQNDFITGSLANPMAQANVAKVADTVREHAKAGHWMFFTKDTHDENYLSSREGKMLPVSHCIKGTDGWKLAPELQHVLDEAEAAVKCEVEKETFGAITLPDHIHDTLRKNDMDAADIERFLIYGYCTDICVISNAMVLRAAFPETDIEVLSDCCAGVTAESHENALAAMAACQFILK